MLVNLLTKGKNILNNSIQLQVFEQVRFHSTFPWIWSNNRNIQNFVPNRMESMDTVVIATMAVQISLNVSLVQRQVLSLTPIIHHRVMPLPQ